MKLQPLQPDSYPIGAPQMAMDSAPWPGARDEIDPKLAELIADCLEAGEALGRDADMTDEERENERQALASEFMTGMTSGDRKKAKDARKVARDAKRGGGRAMDQRIRDGAMARQAEAADGLRTKFPTIDRIGSA